MRLKIRHSTRYVFDNPVSWGLQQLRKTPKTGHQQWVLNWVTHIEGGKKELQFEDHHHNTVELISFDRDSTELVVTSEGEVELKENHGVVGRHPGPSPLWLYSRQTPRTQAGPQVKALVRDIKGDQDLDRLHGLMSAVHEGLRYEVGASHPDWTAEEALSHGAGVCQDHSHVFLSAARHMGFPARYVSGYLMLDDRVEQDAMHAWAEVHVVGLGWVGFDPANGISPDTRYVRVATGLDYEGAAPVTGTRIGGAGEALDVQIEVAQQ
ncbi:transglutaminase family protein [Phaeobacter sp. QD34_3]|uniref:transglutaminase family protein n=1 Tax=unclassified Phaeobacter TaxID=2621772 RepID=UPI00237F689B|nr:MULTISPECIES: transglutaminase family protein [unclassified Phaeobacter]MDE4131482.1 transglutaminase family protein [Phaeobacter sp. QD34_3]MDE4135429.1 transglutaminase family protein [Phaeobacter sp. QD34_24]MDE4175531.1 transglutaminase family protein [Phaeobacter sp. PT47_59]